MYKPNLLWQNHQKKQGVGVGLGVGEKNQNHLIMSPIKYFNEIWNEMMLYLSNYMKMWSEEIIF